LFCGVVYGFEEEESGGGSINDAVRNNTGNIKIINLLVLLFFEILLIHCSPTPFFFSSTIDPPSQVDLDWETLLLQTLNYNGSNCNADLRKQWEGFCL